MARRGRELPRRKPRETENNGPHGPRPAGPQKVERQYAVAAFGMEQGSNGTATAERLAHVRPRAGGRWQRPAQKQRVDRSSICLGGCCISGCRLWGGLLPTQRPARASYGVGFQCPPRWKITPRVWPRGENPMSGLCKSGPQSGGRPHLYTLANRPCIESALASRLPTRW